MVVGILSSIKRRLRASPLRPLLARTGIVALGRAALARLAVRAGVYETVIARRRLRFAISAPSQIVAIDGMATEAELLERLLACLQPDDVVFDVGANLGVVSLLAADAMRGRGVHVHAFEPEPVNAGHLQRSLELNGLAAQVTVHRVALGRASGPAPLYVCDEVGSGLGTTLSSASSGRRAVEVQMVRGSEIVERIGAAPRVLKIDVEGAEMDVLLGLGDVLASGAVRDVFIEVHPDQLRACGSSQVELSAWLERQGFALVWEQARGGEVHQHLTRTCRP